MHHICRSSRHFADQVQSNPPATEGAHTQATSWVLSQIREGAGKKQILQGAIVLFIMSMSLHKWFRCESSPLETYQDTHMKPEGIHTFSWAIIGSIIMLTWEEAVASWVS